MSFRLPMLSGLWRSRRAESSRPHRDGEDRTAISNYWALEAMEVAGRIGSTPTGPLASKPGREHCLDTVPVPKLTGL